MAFKPKLSMLFIVVLFVSDCYAQNTFHVSSEASGKYGQPQTQTLSIRKARTLIAQTSGSKQLSQSGGGVSSYALESANNTFYGQGAGTNNTGAFNAFFGSGAGINNAAGSQNSFFGQDAGNANNSGADNTLFGYRAGFQNVTNNFNSFFGSEAGEQTTACCNAFFGTFSGMFNTTGEGNSFLGAGAGSSNTTEGYNSFIGTMSDGAEGITNATALGAFAKVTSSNSLVLGGINGVNNSTADTFVGIGTTNPDRQLVVEGEQSVLRFRRYYGSYGLYAPTLLMERARGTRAAPTDILPGDYLGKVQFHGRVSANPQNNGYPVYGLFAFVASDTNQNGRFSFIDRDMITERVSILNTGNVGIGTTTPTERLQVVGNLKVSGNILYSLLGNVPDYVFDSDYKLMPIKQLENYLATEKHLPNVPSAAEIKQKDLNLSDFQMKLLEKIEELTLYVVNQAKQIDRKDAEITVLKSQNSNLDARLTALEQLLGKEEQ